MTETQDGQTQKAVSRDRPQQSSRATKWSLWIIGSVIALFVALGLIGAALLQPRIDATERSLNKALPLSSQVKDEILSGDTEKATRTVAQLTSLSAEAVAATDYFLWDIAENIPNCEFHNIDSSEGHDGFLLQWQPIQASIISFLEKI